MPFIIERILQDVIVHYGVSKLNKCHAELQSTKFSTGKDSSVLQSDQRKSAGRHKLPLKANIFIFGFFSFVIIYILAHNFKGECTKYTVYRLIDSLNKR